MIVISGVAVNNRSKEELYRKEIDKLNTEITDLKNQLAEKMQEIEWLVEKVHKMGGRLRK